MRPITPFLVIIMILLSSCATTRQAGEQSEPKIAVRVENRNYLDMKIYIIRGSERIRIGTVTGNTTEMLFVPESFVINAGLVRFLAEPIGSNRAPISQEISVHPGQEVELIITN